MADAIITTEQLSKCGDCGDEISKFLELYPEGSVRVTRQEAIKVAAKFNWEFAANVLLKGAALARYNLEASQAMSRYDTKIAPALEQYEKTTAPAKQEYEDQTAELTRTYLIKKGAFVDKLQADGVSHIPDWDSYEVEGHEDYQAVIDRAHDAFSRKTASAEELFSRATVAARAELDTDCAGAFADCYIMQVETRLSGEP